MIKELEQFMSGQTPATCNESWDLNLETYKYQQEAQQHWNDTIKRTSTGRPIDAYISPVAVSAAVKPGGWVSIGTPLTEILSNKKDTPLISIYWITLRVLCR